MSPTFGEAARFWLKLGFVSFGGPAGQIAILHREVVERRRWLAERPFTDALNFCMLLPGPEALQLAIFLGWKLHGLRGGLVAGLGFIGPAILLLIALSWLYARFGDLPAATGLLVGLKAAVLALVLQALLKIGRRALRTRLHAALAIAAFVALEFLDVPFPLIVLAAGATGLVSAWRAPPDGRAEATVRVTSATGRAAEPEAHGTDGAAAPEAHGTDGAAAPSGQVIDTSDAIETSRATAATGQVAVAGVLLWLLPLLIVAVTLGPQSLWSRLYLFFTQAALVTFGGAYAVLGYVTQHLVGDLAWLTARQAADGLALAETTPGPLVIVLQFMGFMAGWNQPAPLDPAAAAVLAALLASWATFLPSFVLIFLGAPYVERLTRERRIAAALAAITAAVVGIIATLGVLLARVVIVPHGVAGGIAWSSLVLAAAVWLLLERTRLDLLWVLALAAIAGLALQFAGLA